MEELNELDEIYEVQELQELFQERRPYNIRNRICHKDLFNCFDDEDFIIRYRLSKETTMELLEWITDDLNYVSNRNSPISKLNQLLLALRYYSSGAFYVTVGDYGNIHKTTVAKIVKQVTKAISRRCRHFIRMPENEDERARTMEKFFATARFPKVIGVIDGTHMRLFQSPGGEHAELFRNRKGYFSLNVQVTANAELKITDIVARWPGSAHDSHIFNNSVLRRKFENREMGEGILLGDSAYPLRKYLITPLRNPQFAFENLFNEAQIRTRNIVERTFGVWKRRFPILSLGFRCRVPLAQSIIFTTAILHNIARDNKDPLLDEGVEVPIEPEEEVLHNFNQEDFRRPFIDYFSTL